MIDLLYVTHNRLIYTKETFTALVRNTDWDQVKTLHVYDDKSSDSSEKWLRRAILDVECDVRFRHEQFGGPVAAMNMCLDNLSEDVEIFGKVDNDFIVCPGWLGDMLNTLTYNVEVDILGMEPFIGNPTPCPAKRTATAATHIGGKGLIRRRAFGNCRMVANGYQGFTQWQTKHEHIIKAWVTPDLPCFGLDQLPFHPWIDIAHEYTGTRQHRAWPPYSVDATDYWSWWKPQHL